MAEAGVEKPLVTLTGISGYLGAETCLQFLQDGNYRIRGTVRDKNNEAKVAPIREAFGELFDQIELVEADLLDRQSLIDAVSGSTFVIHMASPFVPSDKAEDLIPPALDGTKAILEACKASGVRRCVITSSIAAVQHPAFADRPADRIFDESMWSNLDRPEPINGYQQSKILAERAAWDFQKALPEGEKFELVTILPGFIMGPPMRKESFTSGNFLKNIMEGRTKSVKGMHCCMVDVRDTAKAHLLAVQNPAAANRRFILCHSSPSFHEFVAPVAEKYRPQGWPITEVMEPSDPNEYISLFNNAASKELGVVYTDIAQTMVDMADKMIEIGFVVKPQADGAPAL